METRLIGTEDVGALVALHSECFGAARWHADQMAQSLALATTKGWASCEDSVIISFILCQIVDAEAEILTFCTAMAMRRRGIGLNVLTCALQEIKNYGVQRIFLEVAATNHVALALYTKKGFHILGRRPNYYRVDGQATDAIRLVARIE